MSESLEQRFEALGALYRQLAAKHGLDFEKDVPAASPLTDEEIAQVEVVTGCAMPPLARAFYRSVSARRSPGGARPFREFFLTGEELLAKCQELAEAKKEYDWEHDPCIPLTAEEDFLVCTAEGEVLRFCNNEGSMDPEDEVENMEQFFEFLVKEAQDALTDR
ncbi:MAG: hypothetical protein MUF64_15075 [Polyangiaceae bacterium]|jgi:hypothetical protein|nr:hypothetical protein [Polyangiaceae bacterium]